MGSRSGHIPFEQLVDLVEGCLTAKEQEHTLAHVSACAACAGDMAWLKRVIGLMRADDSVEPPPCVAARVIDLFRSRMALLPPNSRRRIIAVLRFDSAKLILPSGIRADPIAECQFSHPASPDRSTRRGVV